MCSLCIIGQTGRKPLSQHGGFQSTVEKSSMVVAILIDSNLAYQPPDLEPTTY